MHAEVIYVNPDESLSTDLPKGASRQTPRAHRPQQRPAAAGSMDALMVPRHTAVLDQELPTCYALQELLRCMCRGLHRCKRVMLASVLLHVSLLLACTACAPSTLCETPVLQAW